MKLKLLKKSSGALRAATRKHVIERVQPLARFKDFQSVIIRAVIS
jgi:hypothetical protein